MKVAPVTEMHSRGHYFSSVHLTLYGTNLELVHLHETGPIDIGEVL